jgi:hypothetical protein
MNIDARVARLFTRKVPAACGILADSLRPPARPLHGFPVVLLNGPPRVGKDTAGRAIERSVYGTHTLKFAEALKRATHALYGLAVPPHYYEETKDIPSHVFFGRTPREAYIEVSERMTKPVAGADHFGRVMAKQIDRARRSGARLVVITDSGFASEVGPVAEAVGSDAVLLIRLHGDKRGCTFAGDSRSHLDLPGVATRDIRNEDSEPEFCTAVVHTVREWLDYRAGLL